MGILIEVDIWVKKKKKNLCWRNRKKKNFWNESGRLGKEWRLNRKE